MPGSRTERAAAPAPEAHRARTSRVAAREITQFRGTLLGRDGQARAASTSRRHPTTHARGRDRRTSPEDIDDGNPDDPSLRARPVLVPFKRPPASASGAIPTAALVLIDLETDGGVTGRSYVFGFAAWTLGPIVGCLKAMAEMIAGDALAPFDIEAKLRRQLTLLDTPGLVGLALAGIDMAAWDALAQARGVPLVTLLGGAPRPVPAYNSTGLWIGRWTSSPTKPRPCWRRASRR